jgi:hypothetical protein
MFYRCNRCGRFAEVSAIHAGGTPLNGLNRGGNVS